MDSSYIVSSGHGCIIIEEVYRDDIEGIKHIGASRVEITAKMDDTEYYEHAISNAVTAMLKWIDIGAIPRKILLDIYTKEDTIIVASYVLAGSKSRTGHLFCVEKEYQSRNRKPKSSSGRWVNIKDSVD
jgi:hypothetical protein